MPNTTVPARFGNVPASRVMPVLRGEKGEPGIGSGDAIDPTTITQDSTHRFSTDAEKAAWNAKEAAGTADAAVSAHAAAAGVHTIAGVSGLQSALDAKASSGAAASSGLTMSTGKLLGRGTAGTGALEEVAVGTNLSLSGGTLSATGGASPAGSPGQMQYTDGSALQAAPLWREDANTLSQRNGATAQARHTFRTYTDPSNFSRLTDASAAYGGITYMGLEAESAGTGAADISVYLAPKGTGSFSLARPDGTVAGGDVRGAGAIDLTTKRDATNQVASGEGAFAAGQNVVASGQGSTAIGKYCTASGAYATATGYGASASGGASVAWTNASASGVYARALGGESFAFGMYSTAIGARVRATNLGEVAEGFGYVYDTFGDVQYARMPLCAETTNDTPTEALAGGSQKLVIPANTSWAWELTVVARQQGGAHSATFARSGLLARDGAGNTAMIGAVQTVGSDIGSNAGAPPAGWAVAVSADDVYDAINLTVTGSAAATVRWSARLSVVQVIRT